MMPDGLYRHWTCACGYQWDAPITLAKFTANLSGEATQWCPRCGRRPQSGSVPVVHNVHDRRHNWVGSWEIEPLDYLTLTDRDIGRTVIYRKLGLTWGAEAGTLTSFRNGLVFARFTQGATSAACNPDDLVYGKTPRDGDLNR